MQLRVFFERSKCKIQKGEMNCFGILSMGSWIHERLKLHIWRMATGESSLDLYQGFDTSTMWNQSQ